MLADASYVVARDSQRQGQPDKRPAALTTAALCSRPGVRPSSAAGPETDTAATIRPPTSRTGADTEATPGARSATDWAHPRRRTAVSAAAENTAPRGSVSGSSHSSAWAADPAVIGSRDPTGTVSRSPAGTSEAAIHTRSAPARP
jgi:hypothetical protein